jgi:UDP-4-amino-4,6-dideoxy-N-acetyl-beta-L-altrosamine transaminase
MTGMIPYGRQDISAADAQAVLDVLHSDFLTQGPAVPAFEAAIVALCKAEHAVAFNSATSALHVACIALGLGRGDRLWTTPNTFVASANCGLYCGADVDFVDIDPATWNMSVVKLEEKLSVAKRRGVLPKVVVAVHFAGQPTEQEKIHTLSLKYGFKIVEDASHSLGSARNGEPAGSCRWSDVTVFSFHPVKIVTSGEGGMATCNDRGLAERLRLIRSHGITRDAEMMETPDPAPWQYEQQTLGFNYRMTDIHAALGRSQVQRLQSFVDKRNALAQRYHDALAELPLQLPTVSPENFSAYHLYVIRLDLTRVAKTHRQVFEELRGRGIGVNLHYTPVYLQPHYRKLGFESGLCPEAECYATEAISIPMYPSLSQEQQDQVIQTLKEVLAQ